MRIIICPNCSSKRINYLAEDIFVCEDCGYKGSLSGKGMFLK